MKFTCEKEVLEMKDILSKVPLEDVEQYRHFIWNKIMYGRIKKEYRLFYEDIYMIACKEIRFRGDKNEL